MKWSHTGLYGTIPSDREPYRTKRSHTEQYRAMWSNIGQYGAMQDDMEPYKTIRSHAV